MKTAVSLPDRLYEDAERTAKSLGLPRSQLFARALEEFIQNHDAARVTDRLNEVYDAAGGSDYGGTERAGLEALRELTKNDAW